MRGNELLNKMEQIDPAYIAAAAEKKRGGKTLWLRFGAAAACFAMLLCAGVLLYRHNTVVPGDGTMPLAAILFRDCDGSTPEKDAALPDVELTGQSTADFSGDRAALEQSGMLPGMEGHEGFSARARYDAQGNFSSLTLLWMHRDAQGLQNYSDLCVIAGKEEVNAAQDLIFVQLDENGNPIAEKGETVTDYMGTRIVAGVNESGKKTLTFRTENGWYQISGSFADSYESVAELMQWFLQHPIDFAHFEK